MGAFRDRHSLLTVFAGDGAGSTPGSADLVSWWALDDASSPTTWSDGHGSFDLTKTGTVTSVSSGKVNGSADFGGGRLANSAFNNSFHGSNFTVACWGKFDTASGVDPMITMWGSSNNQKHFALQRAGTDTVRFLVRSNSTNTFAESNSTFTATGVWHHFVGVRVGTTLRLYCDGVLQTTTGSLSGSVETTDVDLELGRTSASTVLDGQIDECGVWTKAFTADEVLWHYNDGAGRQVTDL